MAAIVDQRLADPRPAQAAVTAGVAAARRAEARADALAQQAGSLAAGIALRTGPFTSAMTVEQAWRRHSGVQRVFARRHLPACDHCSVRFDETLEEVSLAYELDLAALLEELNALLAGSNGAAITGARV